MGYGVGHAFRLSVEDRATLQRLVRSGKSHGEAARQWAVPRRPFSAYCGRPVDAGSCNGAFYPAPLWGSVRRSRDSCGRGYRCRIETRSRAAPTASDVTPILGPAFRTDRGVRAG